MYGAESAEVGAWLGATATASSHRGHTHADGLSVVVCATHELSKTVVVAAALIDAPNRAVALYRAAALSSSLSKTEAPSDAFVASAARTSSYSSSCIYDA